MASVSPRIEPPRPVESFADRCPVCRGRSGIELRKIDGHALFKCDRCSLVFMNRLADGPTLYGEGYFSGGNAGHGYEAYVDEFDSHYKSFSTRIADTETFRGGGKGRLLDVGCAFGHCGKAALDRGWDVFVTDLSAHSAISAKRSFDLKSFVSRPDQIPAKTATFDCITMFDVIEHVDDPMPLLSEANRCLVDGGTLHLTTPDIASFSARVMGSKWYHYKPGEHLLYFSPRTLRTCLEKAGFEVLKIRPLPMYMKVRDILRRLSRYWNWGAFAARRICDSLGIGGMTVKLYAGEIEVWARKPLLSEDTRSKTSHARLEDVIHCPDCLGDLELLETRIHCKVCRHSFPVSSGVPDLTKSESPRERIKTEDCRGIL